MPVDELFSVYPLAFVFTALLVGLVVGSFLNVVVWRLPKMLERDWRQQARDVLGQPGDTPQPTYNLMLPHSQCPHCAHRIRAWENIPLLSYLWLRGRCSACAAPISKRYPLTELACGLLSAFIAWHLGFGWAACLLIVLTWGLLAMSLIDIDVGLLPDVLVLPLLWLGLIVNSFGVFVSLHEALWGAVAGYMALWSVFWLFKLLTGKDGIGHGDFKLLGLLGAWGGWQILPLTVLLSSLVGAILGVILLKLREQNTSTPIPFGPYLAIAGWIALLWGGQITDFYWQFVGLK
ncbi:prepilin peptidase [Pseudomonas koreensis]|uniref:Prepilin leader peptidase/N-methyltransferase n=1 Tax=Pseudomonas koreensis TaxID=198620 RepID=A0A9X2XMA6_9PSED|nr:A24 family peptidase [Pseudomonas koreensis]MCU7251770.1 A24 family peptidase [Pseudomonas koreensis]